jgi:hypothetical protein
MLTQGIVDADEINNTQHSRAKAINGNITAAIWWTKSRMGWKEASDQNVNVTNSEDMVKRLQEGRDRVAAAKLRAFS